MALASKESRLALHVRTCTINAIRHPDAMRESKLVSKSEVTSLKDSGSVLKGGLLDENQGFDRVAHSCVVILDVAVGCGNPFFMSVNELSNKIVSICRAC